MARMAKSLHHSPILLCHSEKMHSSGLILALLVALAPTWAAAEVVDSSNNGFTVKTTLQIQAPPADVYHRLIHNVGDWWSSAHTFSHDSHNLSIEAKAAGCFCEKLPNEGSARHMEVLFLAPGKTLVLSGGLGPLQSIAATGSMSIQLSPAENGTKLEVTYAVTGYLPKGMNTWAAPVDSVLIEQFTRLKNYTEHGDPVSK
jgi:uncharacterized protein YndB with AHSA1/START domain